MAEDKYLKKLESIKSKINNAPQISNTPKKQEPTNKALERIKKEAGYGFTWDDVKAWESSVNDVLKRANEYLSTDSYRVADRNIESEIKKLINDTDSVSNFLHSNGKYIEDYEKVYDSVGNTKNALSAYLNGVRSMNDVFSQFETEDDYNKAVIGWLNEKADVDEESASARLDYYNSNVSKAEEIDDSLPLYANSSWIPNFAEDWFLSDEEEALRDEIERIEAENNQYKRTQYGIDSNYIPITDEVREIASFRDYALEDDALGYYLAEEERFSGNRYIKNERSRLSEDAYYNELSDDEITLYYYIYNTEGQEAAYQFLNDMKPILSRRATKKREKAIGDANWYQQILLNIASVPMALEGALYGATGDLINILSGEDLDPYDSFHALSNDASAIRQDTAQDIDEALGGASIPWLDFSVGDAYSAMMSIGDSVVASFIPGGNVLLGLGAAQSTMKDIYDRGGSAGQMLASGIMAGVAESFFEKYSIGELNKIKNMDKASIKGLVDVFVRGTIMGGVEASEEMATEIVNTLTDSIVMGSQSNWTTAEDFLKNVLNAGIGGFLSGGATGSFGTLTKYVGNKIDQNNIGKEVIDRGQVGNLLTEAGTIKESGKVVDKLLDKYGKKGKISASEAYRLLEITDNAKVKSAIETELKNRGEKGDVSAIADAVVKQARGDKLSKKEQALIDGSVFAKERTPLEQNASAVTENAPIKENATEGKFEGATEAELVADIARDKKKTLKGFTEEAESAMVNGYTGEVTPSEYSEAFTNAYKMGASGVPSSALVRIVNSKAISERTAFIAYALGQNSNKALQNVSNNGTINSQINDGGNNDEGIRLRDSGKRNGSENSEGQVSAVESGSGQTESRRKTARIADKEAARLLNEGREVKVADLGILGGSKEQTVRVLENVEETESMKKARAEAEASGVKVTFFVGDNLVIEEDGELISARAYITLNGKHVFVRVDHSNYTAEQLMGHELGHYKIHKGEVDINAVRERIKELVDGEYDELAKLYEAAYAGSGYNADQIWEECICDSLGNMNVFAGTESEKFIESLLPKVKTAAESTAKSPTQTRGSPDGKASRETNQGKKLKASRELDTEYLSAVERGDMKTAQRMVDEAAKEAGYTVKGMHATNAEFTEFDISKTSENNFHGKGIYFTNSIEDLENNYENYEGPDPWQKIEARAYELSYDKYGISYDDTLTNDNEIINKLNECFDEAIEEFKKTGRRITAYLRFENPLILEKGMQIPYDYSGYDGIIDKQVYENIGHSGMDENTIHYVVLNPKNIKSADPVTYDDNGKVIPLSERFNTENADIRYSRELDTKSTEHKIRTSMTMAEAKRMIETAFKVNGIAEYYEDEYKDAEDWLKKAGSDEVEMYIENDYDLQAKYINSNEDILNEEYRISDVLDAYLAGALIGKEKPKPKRLDVSQSTKLEDDRFYSPQKIEDAKAIFELAKQKATGKDAADINRARAEILLFAHNKGAAELLGVTQTELNKKLRSWSNYSATAKNISERINAGVAEENRWTGIENSAYISKARVTNEDIERLVESVEGDSSGYERKYIARVMLAADTHIDYSGLKFKFATSQQVNTDNKSGGRVLGFYDDTNKLIEVTYNKPHTVAHEMGHYIDAQWGRDLVGSSASHLFLTHGVNADIVRERYGEPGVQFLNNFKLFINSLSDVNQNYNSYYNDRKEIFARFFARFIEWTDNIATGNKYYSYESTMYSDKFTQAQYVEFARLLQEKALLDGYAVFRSNTNTETPSSKSEIMHSIKHTKDGAVVWIEDDVLKGNKLPIHQAVANYLAQHIGEVYTIIESGQKVYLGDDLPSEYTQSEYTKALLRKPSLLKAKNKALPKLGEMIEIATNRRWAKDKGSGKKDAKYGVYKYDTRFAFPVLDSKGNKIRAKAYDATLIIINSSDGKKYLYDLVTIKENTSVSVDLSTREAIPAQKQVQKESVSNDIIAQDIENVNRNFYYSRELEIMDLINEQAGEKRETDNTKQQNVAQARDDLEKLNVGKGEIMALMKLADEMYENYNGQSTISDFRYGLFETTKVALNGIDEGLEAAYNIIHTLAREVAYNPKRLTGEAVILDSIQKQIKGTRMSVSDADKTSGEFTEYGGYNEFRKRHLGKFILANEGTKVDVQYQELQELYGEGYFPEVNTISEMLLRMAEIVDMPLSEYMAESESELDSIADGIAVTLFERLGDVWSKISRRGKVVINKTAIDQFSNRTLLANALETVVQNEVEAKKLEEYKANIDKMNAEQAKLNDLRAQIKEISFSKGKRDTEKLKALQDEATKTANRITVYDGKLLELEATKALKDVLEREKLKAYRRAAQKGRERLHENVEGRRKTEARHKIINVTRDLDALLNRGTKDKNVKIDLRDLVSSALDISDRLFATDDELLLSGIKTDTTAAEKDAIAEYLNLYSEYNSYDDAVSENKEKRKELRSVMNELKGELMKELKKEFSGVLERERNRINETQAKTAYDALLTALKTLKGSDVSYISAAIENVPEVFEHIETLKEKIGTKLVKDMTLEELNSLYKALKSVKHLVSNANKMFGAERNESLQELSVKAHEEVSKNEQKKYITAIEDSMSKMSWNNLKPIYLMDRLKSKTLVKLFADVLDGESQWARDVQDAHDYIAEQKKKYNYKDWDFKKLHEFTSNTGQTYELSLEQMLSIYAYVKRGEDALEHLRNGGFVFGKIKRKKKGGIVEYYLNDKTAYKVPDTVIFEIIGNPINAEKGILTDEQKAYVDAMQEYLSSTMGAKGNEVSRQLYGIDLFNEENYLPMRSEKDFIEKARMQDEGKIKIKNKGFTKPLQKGANKPIVLEDFTDLWGSHVAEMSSYHAMALPLENLGRVLNYQNKTSQFEDKESLRTAIGNAFGDAAKKAVDQMIDDINGGARVDPREAGFIKKAISLHKKAKVKLSLSVAIQQPTSILRAMALIDPKHFVGTPQFSKKHWNEIKQYAPVAIIKEMGHFDTGMGKSSSDWITGKSTWRDTVDNFSSWLPERADMITWIGIWNAVKRETASKNPKMNTNSKEFLELAGKRFEEIIRYTQVYDSTLSRSSNMRSKSGWMQMTTSFLAEPTTSLNMREAALRSGNKKRIARTTAAIYSAALLNAILVALPYAMRDDDEDETFLEKYASSVASSFWGNINPIAALPFFRDIWSISLGYDVERTDMSLASDFLDSFEGMLREITKEETDSAAITDAVFKLLGDVSAMLGIPIGNLYREAKAIANTIGNASNEAESTLESVLDELYEMFQNEVPIWSKFPGETRGDKLYDAILEGDDVYVERLKGYYKDLNAVNSAIRKALREHDPRINEAAIALNNGERLEYNRIIDEIVDEGFFEEANVMSAILQEYEDMQPKEEKEPTEEKEQSRYKVIWVLEDILNSDITEANAMKDEIIQTHISNGKSEKEAKSAFNSSFKSELKDYYLEDRVNASTAIKMLMSYAGKSEAEAFESIQYWDFKKKYTDSDLTESQVTKYYATIDKLGKSPSSLGISVAQYEDALDKISEATGVDKDGDGKADKDTKKKEVISIINLLPISKEQKDAFYYLNYSGNIYKDTPWR